jgi:hypothetical protein
MSELGSRLGDYFKAGFWTIPAAGFGYAALPAPAYADTQSGATLTTSTAFDTNPFLGVNDDPEVASFRLEVAPTIKHSDGVSEITLQARAEHVEYAGTYKSVQNVSATISGRHRVDARTTLAANVSVVSNVSNSNLVALEPTSEQPSEQPLQPPQAPQSPPPPDVILNDITLLGRQTRRNALTAGASVVFRPNRFDQLSFSSDFSLQRYRKNSGLNDYNFVSHRLAFARQINDKVSIGGMYEESVGDFKYIRFGDAHISSPRFTLNARLTAQLIVNATVGASITRVDTAAGKLNVTAFAGSGSVCYRGARDNFCVDAQRQVIPTALGGIRTQTSLGTNYSVKLSSRDTLQSGTSYSVASAPLIGGTTKLETVRMFGRVERRLNERARIHVAAAYANSSDVTFAKRSNVQALVGLTLKFGRV